MRDPRHRRRRVHRLALRPAARRAGRARSSSSTSSPTRATARTSKASSTSSTRATSPTRRPSRAPRAAVDAIVNFAAETHVDRSILGPAEFILTDVLGTQVLLDHARHHGMRLVQVSTDEVYGDIPLGAPAVHRGARRCARRARTRRRRRAATCRCSRTSAPTASTRSSRAARTRTARASTRRSSCRSSSRTRSTGSRCRSTATASSGASGCTSTTTAPGIELALRKGEAGEVYNIGGQERENLDVVRRILDLTGASPDLVRHVEDRPGHDRRYAVDSSKLRGLGWTPAALVRRGRARGDGRLVPREPRVVGADQVRRLPPLLRDAVRGAAQRLSSARATGAHRNENSGLMRSARANHACAEGRAEAPLDHSRDGRRGARRGCRAAVRLRCGREPRRSDRCGTRPMRGRPRSRSRARCETRCGRERGRRRRCGCDRGRRARSATRCARRSRRRSARSHRRARTRDGRRPRVPEALKDVAEPDRIGGDRQPGNDVRSRAAATASWPCAASTRARPASAWT